MRIVPTSTDFKKWFRTVPLNGDLVFLCEGDLSWAKELAFPILTPAEAKKKSEMYWPLSFRSWYGYSLNQATHCIWFPAGAVESLPKNLQIRLAKAQLKLKVPTLIRESFFHKRAPKPILSFRKHRWVTAGGWKTLSEANRLQVMQAWWKQNEVHQYQSIDFYHLPKSVQESLRKIGFKKLLNAYAGRSGANCFATVAAAATQEFKLAKQWMFWAPLSSILKQANYKITKSKKPCAGDVLVFIRARQPVHAVYYVGEGLYFEKPGQDFYEPYRIEYFENWQKEWKGTRLRIYRSAIG